MPFELGNTAAAGEHDFRRKLRRDQMEQLLFDLALNGGTAEVRLRAAEGWFMLTEGPPKPMDQMPGWKDHGR